MTAMRGSFHSSASDHRIFIHIFLLLALAIPAHALSVANPGLTRNLPPEDLAVLDSEGMIAYTTTDSEIYDAYDDASSQDLPIFVTTDLALHTYHVLFDFALRDAEATYFYPALEDMLQGLVKHQLKLTGILNAPEVRRAAEDNVALLSVPLSILDSTYRVPKFAAARAAAERQLIDAAAVVANSPNLGIKEDYTQYKPRGHYTMSDRLRRYFKAMMFLGRMSFCLCPDGDWNAGVEPTRRALLLCDAFREPKGDSIKSVAALWRGVYEPTAWMVGKADDLLPLDYLALLDGLRGDTPVARWIVSPLNVQKFMSVAGALPGPRTLSTPLIYTESLNTTKGMRLMGQRFQIDSYVLSELVYPKVGTWPDNARLLPIGLDVMAALGSQRARHHLLDTYHEDRFENYVNQLDSVTAKLSRIGDEEWRSTAALQWLYALKLNLEPVGRFREGTAVPTFVRSRAYADKTLMTANGSWAERSHDMLLYAKQGYAFDGCVPPPPPKHQAYAEPKPHVFLQVADMADELKKQLSSSKVANKHTLQACEMLAKTSASLGRIAQKELDGKELDEDEVEFCHGIGWEFGAITHEVYRASTTQETKPKPMAVIADVATDPNNGQVLEVGVGNPCRLYVLIPFYGKTYLAVGGCFSYYEFTKPADQRMTDEEWRALDPKPPMPKWTRSLVRK